MDRMEGISMTIKTIEDSKLWLLSSNEWFGLEGWRAGVLEFGRFASGTDRGGTLISCESS